MIGSPTSPTRTSPNLGMVTFVLVWLVSGICCVIPGSAGADPLRITVSIQPQAWFVENIGGDLVEVSVLVGPGHSPATYEPTPKQMAVLEQADLFLAAGVPFEQGLIPRILALPKAPVVAGPRPVGHNHNHDHDPHTWLDPAQAMAMADTICNRLISFTPADAQIIQERCSTLKNRLAVVDTQARELLSPYRGRLFVVFHPAFGHFAAAYGLVQVAVEADGHEPGPRHLAEVIERARKSGAQAVIIQPQFSQKSAETVAAAIEADIVVLDPLAADYEANLLYMAQTLADLFAGEDSSGSSEEGS